MLSHLFLTCLKVTYYFTSVLTNKNSESFLRFCGRQLHDIRTAKVKSLHWVLYLLLYLQAICWCILCSKNDICEWVIIKSLKKLDFVRVYLVSNLPKQVTAHQTKKHTYRSNLCWNIMQYHSNFLNLLTSRSKFYPKRDAVKPPYFSSIYAPPLGHLLANRMPSSKMSLI